MKIWTILHVIDQISHFISLNFFVNKIILVAELNLFSVILGMSPQLPFALVVSNPNLVSINLVNELLTKSCRVVILTNHKEKFSKLIPSNSNLSFVDFREKINELPNYLFLIEGFSNDFFSKQQIKDVLSFCEKTVPKTQIILPYVINSRIKSFVETVVNGARKIKNRNLQIIYLGQVYGPQMDLFGDDWVTDIFRSIREAKPVGIPTFDIDIYLIGVADAINSLVKGIFSYGFDKREVTLAYRTTAFRFIRTLQQILPDLIFVYDNKIRQISTFPNFDFVNFTFENNSLMETIKSFSTEKNFESLREIKLKREPIKFKFSKKILIPVLVVLWILALPFFSLFVSSLVLKSGFYYLEKFDLDKARFYFSISSDLSLISKFSFGFFKEGAETSLIINNLNSVGTKSADLLQMADKLETQVLGTSEYDLTGESEKIYLSLDDLYKDVSLVSSDAFNSNFVKPFLPSDLDFQNFESYISSARTFAKKLPEILGAKSQTRYLVLLQDKNELRPTGGVITSLVIFNFSNGHLIGKNFLDVKDADNLLRGHVDPPTFFKKYLGQNDWYLKDANWDPDFRITAPRAEWFLSKTTGDTVDGVIAIDADTFETLKNFKGSFLEGGKEIWKTISSRESQFFLNDGDLSTSISNINWDGGIDLPNCNFSNCEVLWLSLVEANLGLNKVNSYITRSANLISSLVGQDIENRLEIDFKNNSQESYRDYVRLQSSIDANFGKVIINNNGGVVQELSPDILTINGHSEAGVLIQIPSNQTASVVFSWSNKNNVSYDKNGSIQFYWRKQAGVETTPATIRFIYPASLTKANTPRYNTNLDKDFYTTIKW